MAIAALTVLSVAGLAACGSSSEESVDTTVAAAEAVESVDTTVAAAESGTSDAAASTDTVDGTWTVASGEAGYRVPEILQGQETEGVGRTTAVTGSVTIAGTQATAASFEFDLTQLKSDSDRRDGQVQGRILETAQFPKATFALTAPIDFGAVPAEGEQVSVKASGDLTLHGVTKAVTVDMQARLQGGQIQVLGSLPITFADWDIENPSVKPFVEVGETGNIEWVVSLAKS
jgi:polyisoprenoid-binding protein YceI